MLPKARPEHHATSAGRSCASRNRRIKSSSPALPRPPRPPLRRYSSKRCRNWRRRLLIAGVVAALAGGAWVGRWYVTHARHFARARPCASRRRRMSSAESLMRAGVPLGVNLFAIDREEWRAPSLKSRGSQRVHVRASCRRR